MKDRMIRKLQDQVKTLTRTIEKGKVGWGEPRFFELLGKVLCTEVCEHCLVQSTPTPRR